MADPSKPKHASWSRWKPCFLAYDIQQCSIGWVLKIFQGYWKQIHFIIPVLLLSGFTLLFCVYLYFFISPLLKDNNCTALRSNRSCSLLPEDPGKHCTLQTELPITNSKTSNYEETLTEISERNELQKLKRRISLSRFFTNDERNDNPKSKMALKGGQFNRCPSNAAYVSRITFRSPVSDSHLSGTNSPKIQAVTILRLFKTPHHTSSGSIKRNSDQYTYFK